MINEILITFLKLISIIIIIIHRILYKTMHIDNFYHMK